MEFRTRSAEARYERKRGIYHSLKSKADANRSFSEKLADKATEAFGSTTFLVLNLIWFAVWIILNVEIIPGFEPFDPFPFGFLTMVVSLEAIILAIFVLISQNRAAKIGDLRQEVDLSINVRAEEEITKILELVSQIATKAGIDCSTDPDLKVMLRPMDVDKIEHDLEKEVVQNG